MLASAMIVFVLGVIAAMAWTAYRHDVVLTDGLAGPVARDEGERAAAAREPQQPERSGYSTWSEEHSASNLKPAADLLVTLPAPYSYVRSPEAEECVCQIIEDFLGDFVDDADVRFVRDGSRIAAAVVAMRSSEPFPPRDRRLTNREVRGFERAHKIQAEKSKMSGRPVLLITAPYAGVAYVGRDHVLVVSSDRISDAKSIMRALLDGPDPSHAT